MRVSVPLSIVLILAAIPASHTGSDASSSEMAPGMRLQHLHGFTDGREASCPGPDADRNGDGTIDLVETEASAGITLTPLHEQPASLDIEAEMYPVAEGPRGTIDYEATADVDALRSALAESYDIDAIDVERRVIFLHGVPEETELPATVRSLPGVPAHVTVPIACGEFVPLGAR